MLLKRCLVGSTLGGMLSVDKGVVLLAILLGMRERDLYILSPHVDDRIERFLRHVVDKQVFQSVPAQYAPSVIHDGETGVEVGVVAKHGLHDVIMEGIVLEEVGTAVGLEEYVRSILVVGVACLIAFQHAFLKHEVPDFPVAEAHHLKTCAKGIDGLHADAVQSYTLLEGLGVILSASIEYGDSLNKFSLRDTTAVVADTDAEVVLDVDLYSVACIHLKLINGVVDDLLEQHIDAVFGQRTVAKTSDIHTGTCADMLHIAQMTDVVVGVFGCGAVTG